MTSEQPGNWDPRKWDMDARGLTFAIVVAHFNPEITTRLLEGAQKALEDANADEIKVYHVPGAFELPLAVSRLAEDFDAIIALGAVIRGDTPHFEYVAQGATQGLMKVSIETETPVAFGVLTTDTVQQAMERAGGAHGNKGYDAAMTAIIMAKFGMDS
jgi:6,7-dimethyl-8-ribityllumazine synthase